MIKLAIEGSIEGGSITQHELPLHPASHTVNHPYTLQHLPLHPASHRESLLHPASLRLNRSCTLQHSGTIVHTRRHEDWAAARRIKRRLRAAQSKQTPIHLIVRSLFWAKHYVVVQYMAAGWKCPLPPAPTPLPDPPPPSQTPPARGGPPQQTPPPKTACSMTAGRQGGQGRIDEQRRIDDIPDAARDFALQLP